MLNFILKYGNVTVYQWKHGEPCPNLVPEQTVTEDVDDSCIDFGLGGASKVVSRDDDGIDFGEVEELEDVTLEITVEDSGVTEEGGVVAVEVNGVDGKTTSNSVGKSESKYVLMRHWFQLPKYQHILLVPASMLIFP